MTQFPDLWGIKCFLSVAEELHFGRAAIRLNMTQPTISQQIRRLEVTLGVSLFRRSTRSVQLTRSGEALMPLARDIFLRVEEAVLVAKMAAGGLSAGGEQLIVGAIAPAAHSLLPLLLRRFRSRFPNTRLDVNIYDSTALVRALERGDCHVGIMRSPTNVNLLTYKPLMSQQFVAVIPRNSPLATRPILRLEDFRGHRVFTLNRFELSSFEAVYDRVVMAGVEIDASVAVSNTAAALALSSAGVGATFLPEWVEDIADGNVVLRPVEDLNQEISIGVGWRNDSPIPGILPFVECAVLLSQSGARKRTRDGEPTYPQTSAPKTVNSKSQSNAGFRN